MAGADVQRIGLKAGYGCVFDLSPLDNPEKTSRYLAKYVSKAVDSRGEVPWLRQTFDMATGEVTDHRTPTYRAGQSSRGWEVKMRDLKAMAQKAAALAAARRRELLDELVSEGGLEPPCPLEPQAVVRSGPQPPS